MADIFLVDDHVMLREGLRNVLEKAGHRVVGEAGHPAAAIADIARLQPSVVLLDLHLEPDSGFDVLEEVQRRKLPSRVVMLTMSANPRHVVEALRRGALGYVLKTRHPSSCSTPWRWSPTATGTFAGGHPRWRWKA